MEGKSESDIATLSFGLYGRIELTEEADLSLLPEPHHVARYQPLGWLHQRTPARAVESLVQRGLDRGLRRAPSNAPPMQPRGDDLGVVDDERVAGLEEAGQVAHMAIGKRGLRARINHQETRGVARRDRAQSDALARQIKVERIGTHAAS
jgi:hypothetical protein